MDVSDTIIPKSDQLNADDLIAGPITVTVQGVSAGPSDQPVHIKIDGGRQPYKPCKSMRRVLVRCWGKDASQWVGKSMRLFCDPTVRWAGKEVGGIRISHLSHIDDEMNLMLTVTRGTRNEYTVRPLRDDSAALASKIEQAKTQQDLDALVPQVALLSDEDKDKLRPVFAAAKKRLSDAMKEFLGDEDGGTEELPLED